MIHFQSAQMQFKVELIAIQLNFKQTNLSHAGSLE